MTSSIRNSTLLAVTTLLVTTTAAVAQDAKDQLAAHIDANADSYSEVAQEIWELAEVGYMETESTEMLQGMLREAGFEMASGVAGMPTAFVASWGGGGPVIGIMGEFDALPGINQSRSPERDPIAGKIAGHACGHHLFGTGSVAAAMAVKDWLERTGQPGTIRVYGTPAEEGGAGKVYMVRAGLMNDVDAMLHWHASSENSASASSSLANKSGKFRFYGQSAHAAAAPWRGRSALDGVEAMHDMVCAILSRSLAEDARLLVVGAGTGMELVILGMNNPGWRFTGVDPSGDMLGVARETLELRGLAERVELFEGLVHDLPRDDGFDAATSVLVMHFLPDDGSKAAYLNAIAERLRHGAPLVLVDQHGPRPSPAFDEKIEQWKRYHLLRGLPAEDVEANMTRRLGANHYVSEERIVALLREAGFEQVERFYQAFVVGGWSARRA